MSASRCLTWTVVLTGLAGLAGCAVGPDYKRPAAVTTPPTYTGAGDGWKVAQPQAELPKGRWWEIFNDPELDALEDQAAAANQQLKVALAQFAESRAQLQIARAAFFPNAAIDASAVRQRTSPEEPSTLTGLALGQSSTFNDFTIPLELSYEVDLWGRVRRNVESARTQAQASADDLEGVKLAIQTEVASDYFLLRAADSEQAVLHSSVQVFQKSLDLTRNRRIGGVATDLDVAQAETVLKTTEAQIPTVALQRTQLQHALAALVGQSASTFQIPEHTLATAPPSIPAGVPSELLERRPDISAAERRMASANANIGVAKAAFFPLVQINGLAGLESINAGSLFNISSRLWSVGPSITLPVFEGGRLRAGWQLANATYQEMVASYRQSVLAAFSDVEDNLAAQTYLANQYQTQSEALTAARKQLEVANNRYRDGLITYLEVATAESTVLNIEFSTTQLRGQQLVAAVSLVRALGGGWRAQGG